MKTIFIISHYHTKVKLIHPEIMQNQFSKMTLEIIYVSVRHSNIIFEIAVLELFLVLKLLMKSIAAFYEHIKALLNVFTLDSAPIFFKISVI